MPPILYYAASVLLDKGFALLTIPLAAAYLAPADFGRLDVAVSLLELAGLLMSLGLGECLLRFASTADDEAERSRVAAELLGTGVAAAVVAGGVLQLLLPFLVEALSIKIDLWAMRWGVLGATVTAFIDMPLMWMRLRQRASLLFAFTTLRSTLQVAGMWLVFHLGYGVNGLMVSNALIAISFAAILSGLHFKAHGIALSGRAFHRAGVYGTPLVLSGLATFAVGSLSRWFIAGRIPDAEIAHLALALKLALATALVLQPFTFWWIARRMAILKEPAGLERSAVAWGLGVSVLVIGAAGINLVAPVFIGVVFPAGYHPAIALLPAAVMVSVMNELNTLSNVGSHLRRTGFHVMAINMAGGATAIAGYALLVPLWGVLGAIAAMVAGHGMRLVLFLIDGRRIAPIPYPFWRAAALGVAAAVLVAVAPAGEAHMLRLAWTAVATLLLAGLALALQLVRISDASGLIFEAEPRASRA